MSYNNIKLASIVLDCENNQKLREFYYELLGWDKVDFGANSEFVGLKSDTGLMLLFQKVEFYNPPTWPVKEGKQGVMAHLDFQVDDIAEAVKHAILCGARVADEQFYPPAVTLFDPEGHPFCFFT